MANGKMCLDFANEVDHILPNDDDDPSNLQAICHWHHQRKSSKEGAAVSTRKRKKIHDSFRVKEKHPGEAPRLLG